MKKLSLLFEEQLLTESRIGQAEKLLDTHIDKQREKIRQGFDRIKDADPSGNQKYLQWSIKQISCGTL
jgi:uncharacterized protein YnzC (UPF0291/DUF896 family)